MILAFPISTKPTASKVRRFLERVGKTFCFFLLFFAATQATAQFLKPADSLNTSRAWWVGGAGAGAYTAGMVGLSALWYADYEQSDLHLYDDNDHWLQIDKAGHAIAAYQISRYGYDAFRWAGVSEKRSIWLGAGYSTLWLTTIELLDGRSAEWGFSLGDFAANIAGTALFTSQQLIWQEQRFTLKFSYSPSNIAQYRPDVLGSTGLESVLKDYNGQTAWLSINPASFGKRENAILPWLNIPVAISCQTLSATGNTT
jgi:uncharacterized protein YfiM (DUF2279 family)